MATEGETRREPEPLVVGALDLPDLAEPAADGTYNGSGVNNLAANGDSPLTASYTLDDLHPDDGDGDPRRVTRLAYGRHIRVLLVESDTHRADDFVRAAQESVLDVRVDTAHDVESALARLERTTGALLRRPLPDIIVTALAIDEAHHLLERLHTTTQVDDIPVIVLADTAAPVAERRSFALGAAGHLVAPRQDYERVALVHALPDFIPRARAAHAHLESNRH